jgi:hypothetical protein
MSDFEVRELRKDEYEEWNSLVDRSPQGTVFHKTSWLTSFDEYHCKIIVCTFKKNIVGGIPLTYTERYGIKFAVNPPFTPYLGIIFRESNQKYNKRLSFEKRISSTIAGNIKDFAPYTEYSFHYNFLDAQPFIWTGFSVKPHYTYVLNLEEPLDTILGNMEKDTRNRIATALKYNIEFLDATPDEMTELIFLTYERKNQKPPYSKQEYERYLNIFSKNKTVKSMIARDEDDLLAGGVIVYDNRSAYYLIGCVNPKRTYSGIGQLTVWNLIRSSKGILGLKEFDFEGSMDKNIEQFFRGFGGKFTQAYIIYKSNTAHYLTAFALKMRSKIKKPSK